MRSAIVSDYISCVNGKPCRDGPEFCKRLDCIMAANHPKFPEYIDYIRKQRFGLPFVRWLIREDEKLNGFRMAVRLKRMIDDPYCRSPLRRRKT